MNLLLTKLAKKLGWSTVYHISWHVPLSGGYSLGDGTYTVKPWITQDNYSELRKYVANEAGTLPSRVTITSITKL